MSDGHFMSQAQAARLLNLTPARVNQLIKEGKLTGVLVEEKRLMLLAEEVEALKAERSIQLGVDGKELSIECGVCQAVEPYRIWKALTVEETMHAKAPCGHFWWQYINHNGPVWNWKDYLS